MYMEITKFRFYPMGIDSLTTEEEQQHYIRAVSEIKEGSYVEVDGKFYLDVYLHDLVRDLKQAINRSDKHSLAKLSEHLKFIIDQYESTIPNSVHFYFPWYVFTLMTLELPASDAMNRWFEFLSKYGWHTNVNDGIISLFVAINGISAQDYVDTRYFNVFATVNINSFLTNFGRNHFDDVLAIIHDLLNRDYQLSNTNYVFKMYTFEDGKVLFGDIRGAVLLEAYSLTRYQDIGIYSDAQSHTMNMKVPVYSTKVRDSYVKSLAREAESILKGEAGIQHRWISERVLFRQIESAFTDLKVQQHASPSFLGRQHYDVYIPDLKVALEYQGEQHFRPINFFGGEEGFLATQERDRRKKEISEKNDIHQIDVMPGYNIATILQDILLHDHTKKYDLDELLRNARRLNTVDRETLEPREKVVSRINDEYKVNIDDDSVLTDIIHKLIEEASQTKIGQRKLSGERLGRYQGLCGKYMRTGEHEKELEVRIMMYARGIKDYSFNEYWREKELIKLIGLEKFTDYTLI